MTNTTSAAKSRRFLVLENVPGDPMRRAYCGTDRDAWWKAYEAIEHGYACVQVGTFAPDGSVAGGCVTTEDHHK